MTWTSPSRRAEQLRDRLLACPAMQNQLTGLDLAEQQARFHYPDVEVADVELPAIGIQGTRQRAVETTAGGVLKSGALYFVVYLDATMPLGDIEDLAEDLTAELCVAEDGLLHITSAEASAAGEARTGAAAVEASTDSEETPGESAQPGRAYRSITVSVEWD